MDLFTEYAKRIGSSFDVFWSQERKYVKNEFGYQVKR